MGAHQDVNDSMVGINAGNGAVAMIRTCSGAVAQNATFLTILRERYFNDLGNFSNATFPQASTSKKKTESGRG